MRDICAVCGRYLLPDNKSRNYKYPCCAEQHYFECVNLAYAQRRVRGWVRDWIKREGKPK